MRRRRLLALALATAGLSAAGAAADPPFPSISPSGIVNPAQANGPSDHIAFSQDNRDMRLVAYDSLASNLVPNDTNSRRDVFVLRRVIGTQNFTGELARASVGAGGRQANGDSASPSLDGTTGEVPHCVAFESTATNLARGDHTPDLDIYVRDLRRHRTVLASPGVTDAHNPSIDGFCRYIAYQAGVRVLVHDLAARRTVRVARGSDPDIETDGKGITYARAGQIYFRRLTRNANSVRVAGRELLVSDTRAGAPGNGVSSDPVVDDHGRHVAFVSAATDLCTGRCRFPPLTPWVKPEDRVWDPASVPSGDANGATTDVYRRSIGIRPGSAQAMVNASYDGGYGQSNAASSHPAISRSGRLIAFQSAATNAIGGVYGNYTPSGAPHIFAWYSSNRLAGWPLQRARLHLYMLGGGPSPDAEGDAESNPGLSSRGNYIGFTSTDGASPSTSARHSAVSAPVRCGLTAVGACSSP